VKHLRKGSICFTQEPHASLRNVSTNEMWPMEWRESHGRNGHPNPLSFCTLQSADLTHYFIRSTQTSLSEAQVIWGYTHWPPP